MSTPTREAETDGIPSQSVSLRPEVDHRVNFAMQQNDVPVVKLVHVENTSELPLRDLRLRITPQPAFAGPWEARVDLIEGKSTWSLKAVDLALSSQYLSAITERLRGELRFELFQGDERIAECRPTRGELHRRSVSLTQRKDSAAPLIDLPWSHPKSVTGVSHRQPTSDVQLG